MPGEIQQGNVIPRKPTNAKFCLFPTDGVLLPEDSGLLVVLDENIYQVFARVIRRKTLVKCAARVTRNYINGIDVYIYCTI